MTTRSITNQPMHQWPTRAPGRSREAIAERIRSLRPPRRGVCDDCRHVAGVMADTCDLWACLASRARLRDAKDERCGPSGRDWQPRGGGRPS